MSPVLIATVLLLSIAFAAADPPFAGEAAKARILRNGAKVVTINVVQHKPHTFNPSGSSSRDITDEITIEESSESDEGTFLQEVQPSYDDKDRVGFSLLQMQMIEAKARSLIGVDMNNFKKQLQAFMTEAFGGQIIFEVFLGESKQFLHKFPGKPKLPDYWLCFTVHTPELETAVAIIGTRLRQQQPEQGPDGRDQKNEFQQAKQLLQQLKLHQQHTKQQHAKHLQGQIVGRYPGKPFGHWTA